MATREELQAQVDTIPDQQLLTDFARLTHLIDSARWAQGERGPLVQKRRRDRDLIEAEILRRMGEGRA
jgi:hypothetical protein